MMYEMTLVQGRVSARKARRKRDSKVGCYHNTSRSPRSPRISTPGSSPKFESAQALSQHTFQGSLPTDPHFLDIFDISSASNDTLSLGPFYHNGDGQYDHLGTSPFQYPLASTTFPASFNETNPSSPQISSPLSRGSLDMSWTEVPSFSRTGATTRGQPARNEDHDGSFRTMSNAQFGGSDHYGYQSEGNLFDFSPLEEEEFFNASFGANVTSPGGLSSPLATADDHFLAANQIESRYFSHNHWASTTHQNSVQQSPTPTAGPAYTAGNAQLGGSFAYQTHAEPGFGHFPAQQTPNYDLQYPKDEFLHMGSTDKPSPFLELESEGWIIPSGPSSSYALSHNSPLSHASPTSHASPVHVESHSHPHLFDSKPKGRQRSLTAKEKKDARDVRDAKACWACHISKTKCSPCSPGNPCAQCARLVNKRRFCKFDCFNDPLESLHNFLVPEYSMARFTAENVASLLSGISWSNHKFRIRLSWGYHRTLEVDVVAIALRNDQSNPLAYQHQVFANGQHKPTLMRKQSPPLGVPHDVVEGMDRTYSKYVKEIVDNDLHNYASSGAYNDDDSAFPKKLLWAACSFYLRGAQADEECLLLRQAIEMHITCTILQRSLILDGDSTETVQMYLRQYFPESSAPKCAARQIKLTFFNIQKQRIFSILKEWGNLMWTIHRSEHNADRWAVGFSVFIMLTLVIDKTLGAAYSLCESRIGHRDAEAEIERHKFRELVRLTETELFGRCKEIFHWKFKTRKAGKEACNPIRDGMDAFKCKPVSDGIANLVEDLRRLAGDFDHEIRNHKTLPQSASDEVPYTDVGRLACVFLDDFLEHV